MPTACTHRGSRAIELEGVGEAAGGCGCVRSPADLSSMLEALISSMPALSRFSVYGSHCLSSQATHNRTLNPNSEQLFVASGRSRPTSAVSESSLGTPNRGTFFFGFHLIFRDLFIFFSFRITYEHTGLFERPLRDIFKTDVAQVLMIAARASYTAAHI